MAASGGRENPVLIQRLADEPFRFDFFQAVRVLERFARMRSAEDSAWPHLQVGFDGPADAEVVRFRAHQSHTFPASSLSELRMPEEEPQGTANAQPPELFVNFIGLTGPSGVLPQHYTALIIERLRARDFSLTDFFDLFNHRTISLFYRAWEKYRFAFRYETIKTGQASTQTRDDFTEALLSLVGLGTTQLRRRLDVDDEAFLFYSGHFSHWPRSALALECVLTDYFQLPLQLEQFQGQWLYLQRDQQSQLPSSRFPDGINCALGVTAVVGERVWNVENKFRIRLGPLDYEEFARFTPSGKALRLLCQIVRKYVGLEYDFDVQLVLKPDAVPWCRAGGEGVASARLGWNTWSRCREFDHCVDDAVFRNEGLPSHVSSETP